MENYDKMLARFTALKDVVSLALGAHYANVDNGEAKLRLMLDKLKEEATARKPAIINDAFPDFDKLYVGTIDAIESVAFSLIKEKSSYCSQD